MEKVYVFIHILAAILTLGPLAVSTSMFPRLARDGADAAARSMHRISRYYGYAGLIVPVVGLLIPLLDGGGGIKMWHIESLVLTAVAFAVLLFWVVPLQRTVLNAPANERKPFFGRLHMAAGVFNLVWIIVLVRMVWH